MHLTTMGTTLQALVTFPIVAIAAAYAVVRLMPKAWRLRLASRGAGLALRFGLSPVTVRRVEARFSSGGACGSCDSCKACATPATTKGAGTAFTIPTPSRHRRIPIRNA